MKSPSARYTIDWGHLLFLTVIAGFVLWYLLNAMSVSMDVHNLLLIAPLSVVALLLCLAILPQCFKPPQGDDRVVAAEPHPTIAILGAAELQTSDKKQLLQIGGVAICLGAYVFLLNVIGFDIATWLFALAIMLICGERRPLPLIIYPILVSAGLISAFRALLPYPMHTVIL